MTKNIIVSNFIVERFNELNLSNKEFRNRIDKAIYKSESSINLPSDSAISKWVNGIDVPEPKMWPFIAEALEVSLEELRNGKLKEPDVLEKTIKDLEAIVQSNKIEKNAIINLLSFDHHHSLIFFLVLGSTGLFFLNATLWKSGLMYLISIIVFIMTNHYDVKRHMKETDQPKEYYSMKNDFAFAFNIIKQDNLISKVCKQFFLLIIILALLPTLENIFYKGTFYITCSVYLGLAVILLIKFTRKK